MSICTICTWLYRSGCHPSDVRHYCSCFSISQHRFVHLLSRCFWWHFHQQHIAFLQLLDRAVEQGCCKVQCLLLLSQQAD